MGMNYNPINSITYSSKNPSNKNNEEKSKLSKKSALNQNKLEVNSHLKKKSLTSLA